MSSSLSDIRTFSEHTDFIWATGYLAVGFVTLALILKMSKKDTKAVLPPGPKRYPVVGNLLQLKGDGMFYVKLNELRKVHGDAIYLELGSVKMFIVFGQDMNNKILMGETDQYKYRPQWLVEVKSLGLSEGKFNVENNKIFLK